MLTLFQRLREHRNGNCAEDCLWCTRAEHPLGEIELVLSDHDFLRWLRLHEAWLDPLSERGVVGGTSEFFAGGIFQQYRLFIQCREGVPLGLFSNAIFAPESERMKQKTEPAKLVLPTKPTEVSADINQYSFFIHGAPTIGKTTFATAEEDVLVLSFDPLRPGLRIMQVHMPDWKTLRSAVKQLEAQNESGKFRYRRVVLDRIDLAYIKCTDYICKKRGINHPSDEGYARAWHALRDEFYEIILRLMGLPCGTWFICHSKWKEIKKPRTGITVERLVPDLGDRAEEILNGLTDGGFAYDWNGKERVLTIQGDETVTAGHNLDAAFRTPDGRKVVEIPAGSSPKEAWGNFLRAFNGKQTFTTLDERNEEAKASKPGKVKLKIRTPK